MPRVLAVITITEPDDPNAPLLVDIINRKRDRAATLGIIVAMKNLADGMHTMGLRPPLLEFTEHVTGPDGEETSPAVAAAAARVIGLTDESMILFAEQHPGVLRSIAGSALTQAADQADA